VDALEQLHATMTQCLAGAETPPSPASAHVQRAARAILCAAGHHVAGGPAPEHEGCDAVTVALLVGAFVAFVLAQRDQQLPVRFYFVLFISYESFFEKLCFYFSLYRYV
jgi:hypothetical protein